MENKTFSKIGTAMANSLFADAGLKAGQKIAVIKAVHQAKEDSKKAIKNNDVEEMIKVKNKIQSNIVSKYKKKHGSLVVDAENAIKKLDAVINLAK